MPIGHVSRNNLYFILLHPALPLRGQLLPNSLDLGRGVYSVKLSDNYLVEVANLSELVISLGLLNNKVGREIPIFCLGH